MSEHLERLLENERKHVAQLMRDLEWNKARAERAESRLRANGQQTIPPDVVALVIAARLAVESDGSKKELLALDQAAEAFASRVLWEDEPAERRS